MKKAIKVPTTIFEVMTLLKAVPDSETPSKINPGLTVSQSKDIMVRAIQDRTGSFSNTGSDILTLTNALAVIYDRKTRGIRPAVRDALARL